MRALWRYLVAAVVLLLGRGRRPPRVERAERIVPAGEPSPRAELLVLALFGATAACAVAFVVVYAVESIPHQTQFLGLSLGLAFAFLAAALIVIASRLVVTEELEEDYPVPAHPAEQEALGQLVEESGDRMTRKRLLLVGGGAAGAALGAALVTPALSLGPAFEIAPFFRTPWRRGVRLVDEDGRPLHAHDVLEETFYTAYPEGADREQLGAPIVVVRLRPAELHLPAGRDGWAPHGIVAYSKICTHAGCAVALYRKPTFPTVEPRPALVCPCHYSTFDPARGAKVLFGPAGRPLPQLPLFVGPSGELRAAGNLSGPVGPAWWGVRNRRPS
ncbi:MAG: ubiquinol-cytochrome c reductase iron-sulfur subunit [Actinobacteria bacterium]|nr:MAG: ubiquinol-cytochrome c reductase iron-sulfur subunit [Actinomycetota bacterium]